MRDDSRSLNTVIGVATVGPALVGIASLAAATVPFFSGEYLAAAVFLIASALSFGLLSLAVLGR